MIAIGMARADFVIAALSVPFLMIYHGVFPYWGSGLPLSLSA